MNKLFTKIATAFVGMAMAIGVGVAIGSKDSGAEKASAANATIAANSGTTATYTVNGNTGIKAGSNKNTGTVKITVPSGATSLSFYAGAWKDKTCTITLSCSGVTFGTSSFALNADSSFTGTGTTVTTTSAESTFLCTTTLTGVTASKDIVLTKTGGNHNVFIVWKATYETSGGGTSYTVSYNANGLSGTTMPDSTGASINLSTNTYTVPTGADFICWNTAADGSGQDYEEGQTVTASLSLYAKWGYRVNYYANGSGEETIATHTIKNTSYTVAANTFDYTGHAFVKWNTQPNGSGQDYLEGATISTPSQEYNLYAQWEVETRKIDIINKDLTGVSGNSYTEWSGKSGSASTAVYAGKSAMSYNAVQIKNGDNSGIISTTSGGTISKIVFDWNVNTVNGRVVDIYGKNEEYRSVSELYVAASQGTKLGSITCGTTTSLTVTGAYAYVGILANANTSYINTIKIYWEPVTSFTVSYNINGGTSGTLPSDVPDQSEEDLKSFTVATPNSNLYKFGYTCDGWSSTTSGSKEYNGGTSYDLSGKVTGAYVYLYAHWTLKTLSGLTAGSTTPTKTSYEVGEVFDPSGLTIHAIFNTNQEDTTTDITNDVVWSALEKGSTEQGSYTFQGTTVYITITGLTITGPDVIISKNTVPSNVTSTQNSDVRTGYIGSVNYEYFAFQTYNSNLEFRNSENGYISNLDSYGKYISSIKITLASDAFSNFAVYKGTEPKPTTNAVTGSGSGTVRTYSFSGEYEYFTFKKTNTGSWYQIVSIEITLGSAVPEKIVNTMSINNPGTIYEGDSKQLTATVTYTNSATVDSNVTWEKVSGTSSITASGMFTAADTTTTVVRATTVLKNAQDQYVSEELSITPLEKMIISGHKYFVVSSDNHIFIAKNLDGTYESSGSSKDKFLSTATLSSNGKYVVSIDGVSGSLEDYAWTINETETDKYEFVNAGSKYFNIYSSGSFYVDGYTENFEFAELNSSGFFTMKSLRTTTYLNISDGTFDTSSSTGSTGYKFIEYKEFGTLDHIYIDESSSKTQYFKNDVYNTSDVKVVAVDTDGIEQLLESGYTCSGYNMSSSGNQTVTVTYSGKTDTYSINVIKWRSVKEYSSTSATITWPSSSGDIDGDLVTSVATSGNTVFENTSMRLGTGSGGGTITITSTSNITSVDVWAKAYSGSYTGATLNVGDQSKEGNFTTSYAEYNFTLTAGTTSLAISTPNSSSRINIQQVVVHSNGDVEIGKTTDCLGLEEYIDNNLHMSDYTSSQGWCKDNEHHYYTTAKTAFNALNLHQRTLFSSNSAYAAEWARLSAWAAANGDSLNASTQLAAGRINLLTSINADSNTAAIVVIISTVSVLAVGGYFFLRRKKEQ